MGKIRRGGYIFITWIGDHSPYHVHVYKNGKLVVKWNLEHNLPMKGKASTEKLRSLRELREDGLL